MMCMPPRRAGDLVFPNPRKRQSRFYDSTAQEAHIRWHVAHCVATLPFPRNIGTGIVDCPRIVKIALANLQLQVDCLRCIHVRGHNLAPEEVVFPGGCLITPVA